MIDLKIENNSMGLKLQQATFDTEENTAVNKSGGLNVSDGCIARKQKHSWPMNYRLLRFNRRLGMRKYKWRL